MSDCWSRGMLNFESLEMGLGLVSPTHYVHDFSRKIFLMLYSINWANFIAWLPLLLEILGGTRIVIIYFPVFDVINFWINLNVLIMPFSYLTKKSEQKFKYLNNEKSFQIEIKSIFHHFERAFSCDILCQTCECAFKWTWPKVVSENYPRQLCMQTITKFLLAYSSRKNIFIGQNFKCAHVICDFWSSLH